MFNNYRELKESKQTKQNNNKRKTKQNPQKQTAKKHQEAVLKSTKGKFERFRSKIWVHVDFASAFCCFSLHGSQLHGLSCKQRNRSALTSFLLSENKNKSKQQQQQHPHRTTNGGGSTNIAAFGVNTQFSAVQHAQCILPQHSSSGIVSSVDAAGLLSERLCRSSFILSPQDRCSLLLMQMLCFLLFYFVLVFLLKSFSNRYC